MRWALFVWALALAPLLMGQTLPLGKGPQGQAPTLSTGIALTLPVDSYGIATSSTAALANTGQGGRLVLVCGSVAGTGALLLYVGTSTTPNVLANGVGSGLIGC